MSEFTIALFDDGLQLVPSSWIFNDNTMCHWPPYMSEQKIRKTIIAKTSPDCTWTTHKILRIFGTSSTYESGIEKVKLAQEYSDLDTSDIDISRHKRTARKKKTFKNDNFVYPSSGSDDSDQNNNTVPEKEVTEKIRTFATPPPPLLKSFIANEPTNTKVTQNKDLQSEELFSKKNMNKESSSTLLATRDTTNIKVIQNEDLRSEELFCKKNMNKESSSTLVGTPGKNIQPEILRRLNQTLAKLNSIDDRLCKVEENQNITQKNKEISVLQELVTLPLKTNEELQNMEKDLENQDFFEQMAISFNRIGGRDSHELIINILKRSIANELAIQYSWKIKENGI
ncbi:uncharacterized protein LOC120358143 [Solenopsis invicta]|uniref:uncharacterized protein LOC120358143 n=1 Tax=Solenopsis invicta TaxID=13686 RepID=UPI00193EA4B1|nr:uncharacterized protein LOC120358143 [Solenopsis invicta]